MNVRWTHAAIVQLELIRSKQIASFPLSGRIVPEYELNVVREVIEGS